jgi:hypothetical protein
VGKRNGIEGNPACSLAHLALISLREGDEGAAFRHARFTVTEQTRVIKGEERASLSVATVGS